MAHGARETLTWMGIVGALSTLVAQLGLTACCSTATLDQSAIVPLPVVIPTTTHSRFDAIAIGTVRPDPNVPGGENAVWVPRGQVDAAGTLRVTRFFSIRLLGGVGPAAGATPAPSVTLPNPSSTAGNIGFSVGTGYMSEDAAVGFRVHVGVLGALMPTALSERATPGAPAPLSSWSSLAVMAVIVGGADLWGRLEDWLGVYGALQLRNEPRFASSFTACVDHLSPHVDFGRVIGLAAVGVEFEIDHSFGITVGATLPIGSDLAVYPMPSVGVRGLVGPGPSSTLRR